MTELRLVRFSDLQAFLDATKRYDDAFMNFVLGTITNRLDPAYYVDEDQHKARSVDQQTFLAIYRSDALLYVVISCAIR